MDIGLAGRAALVVGGGTGIGRATAIQFAREGAAVVVAGRRLDPLQNVVQAVKELGGEAVAHQTDVGQPEDVQAVVQATVDRFGGIHAVANCAAVVDRGETMLSGGIDDFDQVMNVNLRGAWLLIRAGAKAMIGSGTPGAIVSVSRSTRFAQGQSTTRRPRQGSKDSPGPPPTSWASMTSG